MEAERIQWPPAKWDRAWEGFAHLPWHKIGGRPSGHRVNSFDGALTQCFGGERRYRRTFSIIMQAILTPFSRTCSPAARTE